MTSTKLRLNKRDILDSISKQTMNFKTYSTAHPMFAKILPDIINTHNCESHGCNQHYAFFFKAGKGVGECSKVVFG